MKLKLNSKLLKFFPKWVAAFTFGQTIYIRGESISPRLLRHESQHVRQYEEYGIIRFLFLYLMWFLWGLLKFKGLKQAYLDIPFEVEAREAETKEGK